MLAVAEAASRASRIADSVRGWVWEGCVRAIEDKRYPMAELPDEWKTGDDGSPSPNWIAAPRRSRAGH